MKLRVAAAMALLWAGAASSAAQGAEEASEDPLLSDPAIVEFDGPPAEPESYRDRDYRAPVPETLAGARVVATEEAKALWEAGETVFIDVLPRAPKPANLPKSVIWREKKHHDIPGSTWLPNVGYGRLTAEQDAWFRAELLRLTEGDKGRPVLFYCLANCWMSWNAAKRALEYGYQTVLWHPDGVDGWKSLDLPLERREPAEGWM